MALDIEETTEIITDYRLHGTDTGSPEVQTALLTKRINILTGHLKKHIHDHHSRRGLLQMVSRRKRLLGYLKKQDKQRYANLVDRLGLRR